MHGSKKNKIPGNLTKFVTYDKFGQMNELLFYDLEVLIFLLAN